MNMDNSIQGLIVAIQDTLKEFITPDEFEQEFKMSKSSQSKMRSNKTLPYHKIGAYIRYKRSDINAWLNDAKVV